MKTSANSHVLVATILVLFMAITWSHQGISQSISTDSYYQIVAKHSGKAIDVPAANKKNGVQLIQWQKHSEDHQLFRFQEAGRGYYRIIAKHSGKAIDVPGANKKDGVQLIQWQKHSEDHQLFRLQEAGDGYFQIIAKHSGKAIDVYGAKTGNGAKIIQYRPNGNSNQLFKLIKRQKYASKESNDLGQEF